ncbi:MFS transporter [Streptomyces sp. NPDC058401]|uniref:MFS transporter n=1 Tax=Streptomyces sp. NPDC058401 TaxID=3346480 RepID=UPI00365DED56
MSQSHTEKKRLRWLGELIPEKGDASRLAVLTLVQSAGTGFFLTSSAIFFTTVFGFSPTGVGIGLSVAGLCGFLSAVPAGMLADRIGPKKPLLATYTLLSVFFVLYCFVDDYASFVVVACLISVCETAGSPLRGALTYVLFGGEKATRVRAQSRGLFNLGLALGAATAAPALAVGGRRAFIVVALVNACAQLGCAVIGSRLPATDPARRGSATASRSALRDGRFVLVTFTSGVLELYQPLLTIGLPLWIVTHTTVPTALNSVLALTNTVLIVLFQVAVSRGSDTLPGAAAAQRRAGYLLALACPVFALSAYGPTAVSAVTLVAGVVVLCFGELYQAAGSWGISFGLPPKERMGEYQGVFALGRGVQQFLGPAAVTSLVVGLGVTGWVVLAVVFLSAGLASRFLVVNPARHPVPQPD